MENLMVIDWERSGNVVRFYLGPKDLIDFYGDDWNDSPYEHNAGKVYGNFISGYVDMAWDMDYVVKEPSDGYFNSSYCKDDFKLRNIPIIAIHKLADEYDYDWLYHSFNECFPKADIKICMKDPVEELIEKGTVLKTHINK